jgi:hypothetical protein
MSIRSKIDRRTIIKAGAGIAASAVTASIIAKPSKLTPANPEGPFYPKHQQVDKDTGHWWIYGKRIPMAVTTMKTTLPRLPKIPISRDGVWLKQTRKAVTRSRLSNQAHTRWMGTGEGPHISITKFRAVVTTN